MLKTLGRPLGEGRDGPVSPATGIVSQRAQHGILRAVSCRALGVSQALLKIMAALGIPARSYKRYAAWIGEKAG